MKFWNLIGVNQTVVSGMAVYQTSLIPMYPIIEEANRAGTVITVSFSVCMGVCPGYILVYTFANAPEYRFPMIIGELSAACIGGFIGAGNKKKR